jgi:hypothetical protein
MPPIIPPHRLILISTILIPTSFVLARTYIYFSPSAKLSPRLAEPIAITTTLTLTPTTASSLTHRIINPKNHKSSTADSYTATIPGALVAHLSDQEILARFFHGYFNGWSFVPEWCLLGTLGFFGRILIPVEYTGTYDCICSRSPSSILQCSQAHISKPPFTKPAPQKLNQAGPSSIPLASPAQSYPRSTLFSSAVTL